MSAQIGYFPRYGLRLRPGAGDRSEVGAASPDAIVEYLRQREPASQIILRLHVEPAALDEDEVKPREVLLPPASRPELQSNRPGPTGIHASQRDRVDFPRADQPKVGAVKCGDVEGMRHEDAPVV